MRQCKEEHGALKSEDVGVSEKQKIWEFCKNGCGIWEMSIFINTFS